MTIALLFSLGLCIVQIQSIRVNFVCTKRLFNLSAEAIINACKARLCVRCAIFFWRSNIFLFLVAWSRGLHLRRDFKINSRCYWRCVLSRQVLFQQREMRNFWRLCNNSDIHSWFWKVWSLVVCSQSCFYVTRACKDDKNRRNTLFLLKKMNLVPNEQLLSNVPFQSTKYWKKELCVDHKVQENKGDVYCPTCRTENCIYISINKTTSFYDCKKCKVCCHVLKNPCKSQKPTIILFGGDSTHCFAIKTSDDSEKEKPYYYLTTFILRQPDPSTSELEPVKAEVIPLVV